MVFQKFWIFGSNWQAHIYYQSRLLSYSGNKKKIIRAATISGRLTTLLGYSFTDADIIQGFGFLISELFARYYQKKVYIYIYIYVCMCVCILIHSCTYIINFTPFNNTHNYNILVLPRKYFPHSNNSCFWSANNELAESTLI